MDNRAFRWTALVAALVAVLVVAAPVLASPVLASPALASPALASTVQIQDDAHVLDATVVQNDAATLPVGVYIWTTTQEAASKAAFDTDVRNKVNATFPIVIGINTQSRHETIQIGSQAGLSRNAAVAVASSANSAFLASIQSNRDHPGYTAAVKAALDNLRTGLAGASRGRTSAQRVPAHSSGGGLLLIMLIIGVIVVVAVLLLRRRRSRPPMGPSAVGPSMGAGPPPMDSYPGYGPSYPGYGQPYRSGMSPGAAGAIGAVGGGLLGYELGKMQGEEQQFRRDEMYDRDRGGQYDSSGQGDWVVGQDSDFGDGGSQGSDGSGSGGDW